MRVAVDADVMIDALRIRAARHKRSAEFFRMLLKLDYTPILSPIVTHELYTGAYSADNPEKPLAELETLFSKYSIMVEAYTQQMSKVAGEKAALCLSRVKSVQLLERKRMDIMIGSHAKMSADAFVTWNKEDYREVGYGDLLIFTPDEFRAFYK